MLEGEMGVYTGSSRQGKTAALKQKIRDHKRVVVWSVKEKIDQYGKVWPDTHYVQTIAGLKRALIERASARRFRIVFMPSRLSEFTDFCRLAYAWAMCGHGINLHTTVVAEELSDVTNPGKAPETWGVLIRQGLGWGANIYALTQRPAESDKTVMGNATYIHAHYSKRAQDRKYVADEMDASPEEINSLDKLEWLESRHGEPLKRGKVRFK